jgi:glycerol-3-phosphate dehydrogenase (NAD(P)+)
MAELVVLGAGMMGTSFCVPLVDRGHTVRLVGTHLDREIVESLASDHYHPKLRHQVPATIEAHQVEDLPDLVPKADAVILGVSSAGVVWAGETLAALLDPGQPVLMVSKGLQLRDHELVILPKVLEANLTRNGGGQWAPAAVAGPCIAGELARRVPTCVVFTGTDENVLARLRDLARTDYYHIAVSTDAVGVEVCAALKNAYAMGIAFAQGLHEASGGAAGSVAMHNYEAAVFGQAIIEMNRIVTVLGGRAESVVGLPGVGDLNVTCNGGRTGRFGRFLGMGLGVEESVRRMEGATLECLEILAVMRSALPVLERRSSLSRSDLPLMMHMIDVALNDAAVAMPFEQFVS